MGWGVKTIEQQIEDVDELIAKIRAKIDEAYKSVQDFRVDYYSTDNAIKYIKTMNSEIKRLNTAKRKLKEKL